MDPLEEPSARAGFHPVYIDDVFKDRYKVPSKIGYDLKPAQSGLEDQFRALKVLSAKCYEGTDSPIFEREILAHLRDGDRDQIGFGAWFAESRLPNSVMPRFTIQLLLVLDFAYEHNVIHADNIFVKFRDYSLIESGYLADVAIPQQDRSEGQYSVVPSTHLRRYYFNEADNWGVSSWADRHLSETIQPVTLRSPEVLFQAQWDASTDFWNLGAVVLEVFQAVPMFSGLVPPDGHYELKEHLAEIVDLFGPFPNGLLARGNQNLVQNLFGGDGRIKDAPPMNRPGLASEA
ncbi:hypothetical protein BDV36DRAFT_305173 [Aspergillus pseudocaelatus]|uniref:Protein kinase domain-containing protein n=1 Tax=Aspergillus pseudocaelatus TaxID=1825620 RepID=A0ABQ6WW30_9EURO|nr:hypothetical protein BDV36DRAFT_305173 [Aspergillus pseudocaelatus]